MIIQEIIDKYEQERIRCTSFEDFKNILKIFDSNLCQESWFDNEQYTLFLPLSDRVIFGDKGDEILAKNIIEEYNNIMKKEEFIKKWQNNFIRCSSKDEFNEILKIFGKSLNGNRWDLFEHYTLYNPIADNCLKLIGDKDYYDAQFIIDEYNDTVNDSEFLFEDGATISKDIEKNVEISLETAFDNPNYKGIFERPKNSIEDISKKSLDKIEDYIKDSFKETKDKFEKIGDHTPSPNDTKTLKEHFDKLIVKEKVNHPNHYGGEDNPYEAIKIIEAHNLNFVEGNVIKYLLRYKLKNGFEDLQKALWYMNRLVQNHKL